MSPKYLASSYLCCRFVAGESPRTPQPLLIFDVLTGSVKVSKRAAFTCLLCRLPEERFFSSMPGDRDLLFEVMAGEFLVLMANLASGIGSFKD